MLFLAVVRKVPDSRNKEKRDSSETSSVWILVRAVQTVFLFFNLKNSLWIQFSSSQHISEVCYQSPVKRQDVDISHQRTTLRKQFININRKSHFTHVIQGHWHLTDMKVFRWLLLPSQLNKTKASAELYTVLEGGGLGRARGLQCWRKQKQLRCFLLCLRGHG